MATYIIQFSNKIINMQDISESKVKLITAIGAVVRKIRKKQGKSMYEISAEVSMSKSTWREVEIGACKDIKLTTLWKIAEGLDITPAKLLDNISSELGDNFSLSELK